MARKKTLATITDGKRKMPSYQNVIPESEYDLQTMTGQVLKETAGILRDVVKKRLSRFDKAGIETPAVYEFRQSGTTLSTRGKRPSELRQDIRNMVQFLESETGSLSQAREIEDKVLGRKATREDKEEYWEEITQKAKTKAETKKERLRRESEIKRNKKSTQLFWNLMHRVGQLTHSKRKENYERVREIVNEYAKEHPYVRSEARIEKLATEINKIMKEEFETEEPVPWATIKTRLR